MSGHVESHATVPVVTRAGVLVRVSACPVPEAPVDRCVPEDLAAADGLPAPRAAERLAARALLRRLLAETADEEATAAPLLAERSGRPFLGGRRDIAVSLSHCDGWAAAAVGLGCRVGVDVQPPRPRVPMPAPPHPHRRRTPRKLPDASSDLEVAWIWSVQEACVKATGNGLAGRPWLIPVEPGARAGRWGPLRWAALREHFPVPVSCAWALDPDAHLDSDLEAGG